MRSMLASILSLGMIFSLAACGSQSADTNSPAALVTAEAAASGETDGEFVFTDTITVIVPFTADGAGDQIARLIQPYLEKQLGVSTVIENPEGAGGSIGTMQFLDKPSDGYTIMFGAPTNVIYRPLTAGTDYSYEEDLMAVSQVTATPLTLAVKDDSPYQTAEELLAYIKSNPGIWSYANAGAGSITDIAMQLLVMEAGLEVKSVPFSGTAEGYTAVMGNHVNAICCNVTEAVSKEGIHPILNLGSDSDNAMVEGIPTCKDLGYEGCVTDTSFGYYYKKDVPANVIEAFDNAVAAALENPECIKAFEDAGMFLSYMGSADYDAYVTSTIEATAASLKALGLAN